MRPVKRLLEKWSSALCGLLMWGAVLLVAIPVRADLAEFYTLTALGNLGRMSDGTTSVAYGVNNDRHIVGGSYAPAPEASNDPGNDAQRAFLYGAMTNLLGSLGGVESQAFGINDAEQVVGISDPGTTDSTGTQVSHAFLYRNGIMTDLGTLGGPNSIAFDINDAGQVVGYADVVSTTQPYHAFLYTNGTMTDVGTLRKTISEARGINSTGQVVGWSYNHEDGAHNAFVYRHGSLSNLNNLLDGSGKGWTLEEAIAVTDNGQIVVLGVNPLGLQEAFLLTPIPGLLMLLVWRARMVAKGFSFLRWLACGGGGGHRNRLGHRNGHSGPAIHGHPQMVNGPGNLSSSELYMKAITQALVILPRS